MFGSRSPGRNSEVDLPTTSNGDGNHFPQLGEAAGGGCQRKCGRGRSCTAREDSSNSLQLCVSYTESNSCVLISSRDLKPENILLDHEGHIILTDFGLCKEGISLTDTTTTFCGTPEYLAPEVLRKQPYDNTVDWWCLGSVLYEMLFGLPPFYSRDTHEMYDNILHKPLVMRPGASSTAWSILQGLLEKDGTHRLGSRDDFNEIKAHSFFSSINWDDLDQKKIPPPFTPNVSSCCDISNFDPEFTDEMVPNSICWSQDHSIVNASVMEADDAFVGFSYAPASDDSFL
ncbi:serine/threonine-protein kinase Sgk3-like [Plectropomus leopardus]|uniref:serine/threonine-protein kinase Sgk3-like n=2 Tax=Plectropomus leopardus TaxID=160734 RepID=UPI001C4D4FA4|nr:serine/threonine-protein kinase Sgk3-like [Plectropomus leopardus]